MKKQGKKTLSALLAVLMILSICIMPQYAFAAEIPTKDADEIYHYIYKETDTDGNAIFEREAHFGGEADCCTKAQCEKCGAFYGEINEYNHNVVTDYKSATCKEDGLKVFYCANENCQYYNKAAVPVAFAEEIIGASGHNYGNWEVVQQGSCEAPQIQRRKCTNYGCNDYDEKIMQATHTWMIEPQIDPTCTTVGYTEFRYCIECHKKVERSEIPTIAHKDKNGDGFCDYCASVEGEAPKCNCLCHKTGILKLFYSIVRFFWSITKSSQICNCGAIHY